MALEALIFEGSFALRAILEMVASRAGNVRSCYLIFLRASSHTATVWLK
jgi:hypothetical protein